MANTLLSEYMDGFAEVPAKLQQAFGALGALDEEDTAVLSTVNELVAARLAAAQGLGQEAHDAGGKPSASGGVKKVARAPGGATDPDTQAALDRIAAASSSLAEHGAQRCGMAQEYYDYVDALIVRLDKDLAACDAELFKHSDAAGGRHRGKDGAASALASLPPGASPALPGMPPGGSAAVVDAALAAGRSDLAVDPAEPLYCTCQRVSFGDMVACENDACPVEWYHYECVGLPPGQQPKGKWFCSLCQPAKKVSLKITQPAAKGGQKASGAATDGKKAGGGAAAAASAGAGVAGNSSGGAAKN